VPCEPAHLGRFVDSNGQQVSVQEDTLQMSGSVTDLKDPIRALARAREHLGAERVLVPDLLTGRLRKIRGRAA
jgi:hypothetical protein